MTCILIMALRNRRSPQVIATITISSQNNPLIEVAMSFLGRIFRIPQYTVSSLPAALELLRDLDPALANVLPEESESGEAGT